MFKRLIPALAIIVLLGSCSGFKPLASAAGNKQVSSSAAESKKTSVTFLNNISTENSSTQTAENSNNKQTKKTTAAFTSGGESVKAKSFSIPKSNDDKPDIEKATALQFKYALLLNTEVEYVQNMPLYQSIDDWYGTRYRYGGTTKKGIDCSSFVQNIFIAAFGISLPRTARDQYKICQRISSTELQEGDLLFFNTRGGVSHVGIYLQNNKFVHASVSGGVMISDMFEPYYLRKFIGAGRITNDAATTSLRP